MCKFSRVPSITRSIITRHYTQQNMNQTLSSRKTPYTSPYLVSFESMSEKIDRIMPEPHYMYTVQRKLRVWSRWLYNKAVPFLLHCSALCSQYIAVSFFQRTHKKTPHCSPLRARYDVSFVSSWSEQSFGFLSHCVQYRAILDRDISRVHTRSRYIESL